ncbi:ABC transporter permease [Cohnella herbarum]|uniref:ABC transporter permease n=1 Tax=Cohnella herbarum TaxID=2728023 RepID=UPI0020C2A970|nr:ABC transporter permease subunit [Cohnella herbarum]
MATPHVTLKAGKFRRESFTRYVSRNHPLYVMLIPCILFFIVFKYVPIMGSIIAFQDYKIFEGILKSEWVGFKWFEQLFSYPQFTRLIGNTLLISFYQLIFSFPAPIILAVLLNEIRSSGFKRTIQTIVYLPHFLSWTIIFGFVYMLLSPQTGMINGLIADMGFEKIHFLQNNEYIRSIIVGSGVWKEMGWSSIIFLAAIAGINPSLYEAARIDGASRWKQFLHVTFPGVLAAVVILLLLKIGHLLDLGFEQIYIFLTPANFSVADVLDTYTYRIGIKNGQYSLTTAIGFFKSIIGFSLLVVANRMSKWLTGEGLY